MGGGGGWGVGWGAAFEVLRVGWIWCFGWDVGNWLFGSAGLGMLLQFGEGFFFRVYGGCDHDALSCYLVGRLDLEVWRHTSDRCLTYLDAIDLCFEYILIDRLSGKMV